MTYIGGTKVNQVKNPRVNLISPKKPHNAISLFLCKKKYYKQMYIMAK